MSILTENWKRVFGGKESPPTQIVRYRVPPFAKVLFDEYKGKVSSNEILRKGFQMRLWLHAVQATGGKLVEVTDTDDVEREIRVDPLASREPRGFPPSISIALEIPVYEALSFFVRANNTSTQIVLSEGVFLFSRFEQAWNRGHFPAVRDVDGKIWSKMHH